MALFDLPHIISSAGTPTPHNIVSPGFSRKRGQRYFDNSLALTKIGIEAGRSKFSHTSLLPTLPRKSVFLKSSVALCNTCLKRTDLPEPGLPTSTGHELVPKDIA